MTRLWCALAVTTILGVSTAETLDAQDVQQVRDRWDKVFTDGASSLNTKPNALLVSSVKGRAPGTALDLGIGQGRNAIYLAENGWKVTGVDLSEVAVQQAERTRRLGALA